MRRYHFDLGEEPSSVPLLKKRKINIISNTIVKPAEIENPIDLTDDEEVQPRKKKSRRMNTPQTQDVEPSTSANASQNPDTGYDSNDEILSQIW